MYICVCVCVCVCNGAGRASNSVCCFFIPYRGTSLMRNTPPAGLYSSPMPSDLRWSQGGGLFLMSEVPLHHSQQSLPLPCPAGQNRGRGD